MSTFSGKTKEYPHISIDRFDGDNIKNFVFFLSHNHKDHTVGLFRDSFIYKLENSDTTLYCSPVTRDLIMLEEAFYLAIQRCPQICKRIVALETEVEHSIPIKTAEDMSAGTCLTVTLLPAKHCPGSVMFLIEGEESSILYTGDFRLDRSDLERMPQLHSANSVKSLKSVYIDSTFCAPEAFFIPSRDESVNYASSIIEEWVCRSPHHVIHLSHAAGLGYEQLYRELSLRFNMKVHVSRKKFAEYRKVGDMHSFTTPNPAVTQIHACKAVECGNWRRAHHDLPCGYLPPHRGDELHVRTIKLSTMAFVQHVSSEKSMMKFSDYFFRVCYSFHSSYSELRDVIMYLKPDRVFPNVVPIQCTETEVQKRLNWFLKQAHKEQASNNSQEVRPLGELKIRKRSREPSSQYSDNHHFDFMDDSPPKKPKGSFTTMNMDTRTGNKSTIEMGAGKQERDTLCDTAAFPTLFGNAAESESEPDAGENSEEPITQEIKSTHKDQGETTSSSEDDEMNSEAKDLDTSASQPCRPSQHKEREEADDELPPEDVERLKDFVPVAGGSYGELVGYASEIEDEGSEDEEEEEKCSPGGNSDKDSSVRFQPSTSKILQSPRRNSFSENSSALVPLSSRLKRYSEDRKPMFASESCTFPSTITVVKDSTSGSTNEQEPQQDEASSEAPARLSVVDISEAESDSNIESEMSNSGRKRRLSENILLDPTGGGPLSTRRDRPRKSDGGRSGRAVSRQPRGVVQYPPQAVNFLPSHYIDRTHAVRGYHNLMTNIEKILKSPTRNSWSDEGTDNPDVVVLSDKSPEDKCSHRTGKRRSKCDETSPPSPNQRYRQHFKHKFRKTKPSATISKPTEDSEEQPDSPGETTNARSASPSTQSDPEPTSTARLGDAQAEEVCIDLTVYDASEGSSLSSSRSPDLFPSASKSSHVGDEEAVSLLSGSDAGSKVSGENISDDENDNQVTCCGSMYHEKPAKSQLKQSTLSCSSSSNSKRKKLHKKSARRRSYFDVTTCSSDSDIDSASYQSDEWFIDVDKVRNAQHRNSPDKSKLKTYNRPEPGFSEVIVLDDSSNCSASRPGSNVCVVDTGNDSLQCTVSPLAHRSTQSVLQLPQPVPRSWHHYGVARHDRTNAHIGSKRCRSEGDLTHVRAIKTELNVKCEKDIVFNKGSIDTVLVKSQTHSSHASPKVSCKGDVEHKDKAKVSESSSRSFDNSESDSGPPSQSLLTGISHSKPDFTGPPEATTPTKQHRAKSAC